MSCSTPRHEQSVQRGLKISFLVHLLKITRVPSPVPRLDVGTPRKSVTKNALKVTALYSSKQVALGDFRICNNTCTIDQQLICQLNLSKSDGHSKLHLYIDQACSSGLTGHMVLDLKEFIGEGDTEIYLKYPLYASMPGHNWGPILKITVHTVQKGVIETLFDEDNDILVIPQQRITGSKAGFMLQDPASGHYGSLVGKEDIRLQHLDETRLLKLEGALSDLDEKLKILASAYKNIESARDSDGPSHEAETQSSSSSLLTGTCVDSSSELYEKPCTDSDDATDSYPESESIAYPLPTFKHSRTSSDISCLTRSIGDQQAPVHKRNKSIDEVSSDLWYSQPRSRNADEEYDQHCPDDCFVCSTNALGSFKGICSSLSSSSSVPISQTLRQHSSSLSLSGGLSPQPANPISMQQEVKASVSKKGPGLLKSLFGAVVFAGVSLLGVRNASQARKDRPRAEGWDKFGQAARSSHSDNLTRPRTIRNRYSSRSSFSF